MKKIKLFLKQESSFLRNMVLVILGFPFGIYKIFYQTTNRFNSVITGLILIIGCIAAAGDIVLAFKGKQIK